MTEAALAACDAVRLEKAHLRPPKTEAVPHDIVDLLGGGDTVVHEPERLAPHRLEKTIADEGVDLDSNMDRLHRHPVVGRHRCVDRVLRGEVATDDLDDRHEVHRVVRMADNQPLRVGDRGLEIRGLDARGRRRNDGVGRTGRCDLLEDRHLDGRVFRNAFLDVDRALDRLGDRADDTDTAFGGGRQAEIDPGRSGVVEDLIDNAAGFRVRVGDLDVDAVHHEACRPGRSDNAGADDGDVLTHCFRSFVDACPVTGIRRPS